MGPRLRGMHGVSYFRRLLAVAAMGSVAWQAELPARADDGPAAGQSAPAAERPADTAAPSEATYVVSYPAADILDEIQCGRRLDAPGAKDFLRDRVQGPPVLQLDMAQRRRVHVEEPRWRDAELVVAANQAGHEQVAAMLAAFRQFGVAEYAITIRFVALLADQARKALADSSCSLLSASQDADSSPDAGPPAVSGIPPQHHGPATVSARTVEEEDAPLWFRVLDSESEARLRKFVEADPRTNVLDAPRITTFNGQTASAADVAHSQFVVGATVLASGQCAPKTRDVCEGTAIHVRPVAEPNGDLHLDFAATFTKIEKVTAENLKLAPDRELALRIPRVCTLRIQGGVALRPGQALMLGSVKRFAEARKVSWTNKLLGGWILPKEPEVEPAELILLVRVEPFQPAAAATARVGSLGSSVACHTPGGR